MSHSLLIAFVLFATVMFFTPGPNNIMLLSSGLTYGFRPTIPHIMGITIGFAFMVGAVGLGLGTIFIAYPVLQTILKYAGVAYLLWMAWMTLKESGALSVEKQPLRSNLQVIVHAILINILNPKLTIFFFAFLPQFVGAHETDALPQMLELSAVFMLLTFVVFVGYGLFAAAIRTHVISRPKVLAWMRRTFAAAFVVLGAKLAIAER